LTQWAPFDFLQWPVLQKCKSPEGYELFYGAAGDWGNQGAETPMYAPDEFLKQAAECERMAKLARSPANKATWSRMAERWLQCAEANEADQERVQAGMAQARTRHKTANQSGV
jgi:hypothetical protein